MTDELQRPTPFTKEGHELRTLDQWREYGGPKRANQWRGGRSAKEVARAWLNARPNLPDEVMEVLTSNGSMFHPVGPWTATPEVCLALDGFKGSTRNTDMLVHLNSLQGAYLVAVEAKADEPFGETVADALAAAVDRGLTSAKSNGVKRIEQLAAALLSPRSVKPDSEVPRIGLLRYQLLTAIGGLLYEASKARHSRAVFLVHEFHTFATREVKHQANAQDLEQFVTRLTRGACIKVESGKLYGPFRVPGAPNWHSVPDLYIGKALRYVPDPAPGLAILAQQGDRRFILGNSPNAVDGFLCDDRTVTRVNPADIIGRGGWATPDADGKTLEKCIGAVKSTF